MATVDALIIGRKTYETVLAFESWPYGRQARRRAEHSNARPGAGRRARGTAGGQSPRDLRASGARGVRHAYVDGESPSRDSSGRA